MIYLFINVYMLIFLGEKSYGSPVNGVAEQTKPIPQFFDLSQNYPNPFSGSSQIDFTVVEPKMYGKVISLIIYDMKGREITNIYNGFADGMKHTISIEGAEFPAGTYFYELSCDNWHLRKKMTIVHWSVFDAYAIHWHGIDKSIANAIDCFYVTNLLRKAYKYKHEIQKFHIVRGGFHRNVCGEHCSRANESNPVWENRL